VPLQSAQGWAPLVEFLNRNGMECQAPAEPFPHLNESNGLYAWAWSLAWRQALPHILMLVALAISIIIVLVRMSKNQPMPLAW
jgi:hypothetical protein